MKGQNGNGARRTLRVGDRVRFRMVKDIIEGVIVEDRGFIGAGGRRLWRIEFHMEPDRTAVTELPEELLLLET
jgi:hypothetical protein